MSEEELTTYFWERVKRICKERKITQDNLCAALGFNIGSHKNRIVRHIAPDVFDATKIASYLGVSVEYLVTGTQVTQSSITATTEMENKKLKEKIKEVVKILSE